MYGRWFANVLIGLLALWGAYTIVATFLGIAIYFPFRVAESQEIPYHRWQSVRLAMIATFVFYGLMHLIFGSREVYPVHFLKTYLFMLSIVGTCVFLKAEVPPHEYLLAVLFFWIAITLHLASGQRMRRYFSRK